MFLCSLGYFPKGFLGPLKYWKGVRIYKLTIRPISNVILGNKEENILHYLKLFLFYSFSPSQGYLLSPHFKKQ